MNIEDDVIMDMLGPKKHLLAKSFQKDDESEEAPTKLDSVSNIQKTEKFCPKCGEHFNEDDRFCTSCGNKRNIIKIESKDEKKVHKKIKNLKLEDELNKVKSYLESITVKEKGKIYDLNYWFDQVVTRVESHDLFYNRSNVNNLNDLKELAHSHYEEYHHRMIEENDENS